MTGCVVRGDAVRLPLRDESVDLIVTSPPYFALRSYQDGGEHYEGQIGSEPTPAAFLAALWACTAEWQRVLKPSGSIFVNLGDKYAGSGGHNNSGVSSKSTLRGNGHVGGIGKAGPQKIKAALRSAPDSYNKASDGVRNKSLMGLPWRYAIGCIEGSAGDPMILRAELVWNKPNGLPESARDRVQRKHEQWFHLTKEGTYFADIDAVREPHAAHTLYCADWEAAQGGYERARTNPNRADGGNNTASNPPHPDGKIPGSVWTVATEPLTVPAHLAVDHFAAFPQEWPRRIILGWSPSGICMVCGEGRRPVVHRVFTGDYNASEGAQQRKRSSQSGGTAKVTLGRTDQVERSIAGEACACPLPDAPTRPAVVLDPFSGTGTVAGVANTLGRTGIGVDMSADYCRLAAYFIRDGHRFAKAASRTDAERQGALL